MKLKLDGDPLCRLKSVRICINQLVDLLSKFFSDAIHDDATIACFREPDKCLLQDAVCLLYPH